MKRRLLLLFITLLSVNFLFASTSSVTKIKTRNHQRHSAAARSHRHATTHRKSLFSAALRTATGHPLLSEIAQAPIQQYGVHSTVDLAPSAPEFTAVDPFRNGLTPNNPLKPARPFWYSIDKYGLTIVGLRTETTGALMVGGPPINVVENQVVGYVPWPDAISIVQPDGEVPTDPTVTADHNKFAWRETVGGWEPVGITVSYPTEEALASNSETPPTYVYVVMKHSGYEWRSTAQNQLPAGRDPNVRDTIVPQADQNKDGSLLVQVDVSQPDYPADLFPTGPPIGGGLLGHNAGQPAFDPATEGSVYVGNMPSTSLPTTPQVPNDLTSFVSVATLAPGELPVPGEVPAPVTVTVLCGPEHPEVPILAGVPQAWACIAEGGEGPFQWTFTNLPSWLTAHVDPIAGQGDGILYGTPTVGTWTFQAHVDDYATTPPGTGDATITLTVTKDPTTEYEYGELEFEVGTPAAVAIEGTGSCELAPTSSLGSLVPSWIDVMQVPGRTIDNTALGGPVEHTIGCVVMGTPPISGESYEFHMPNFKFTWPTQNLPIIISGQVGGPYNFDALPKGVGLSGLAWHEIDKIHDPSTEADLLNREFFGVEPYTGQMYRILPAYAGLEAEGTVVPPPALQGELDEVSAVGDPLTMALAASRPDIAAVLTNPNMRVRFGDLVVEANPNPNVYVTAGRISDPTGVDPTIIPIGGPVGSPIAIGAMMKVSGTRDLAGDDPTLITWSAQRTIDLPGVQAYMPALDSDLAPAVRDGSEPGQVDHGVLWVTGTNTGNVEVVETATARYAQMLAVPSAVSLGNVSVNPDTRFSYASGKSLRNVTIFGPGNAPRMAPVIWSASSITFTVGTSASFTVMATGSPTRPALSVIGALPSGVTFTDNSDGTATLAGTPGAGTEGSHSFTITAANGVSPDANQNFTLSVSAPQTAPAITSANMTSFTVGSFGSFTVTTMGSPVPTLSETGGLPSGVTFKDNGNGTATLAGTPAAGTQGEHPFTITASNGVPPDAIQNFALVVNSPGGGEAVTLSPLSLSFSYWVVNTTSTLKTVTLTNSGTGPLTISNIATTGNFAIASKTCGASLAAATKCTVKVTFTPTVLGKVTGALTFTDNAPNSPQTVALAGTGVLPAVLSPTSVGYGNMAIATTSVAKTFTLTNWQTVSLNNIAAVVNGDYAISATTCPTSLAAKGKCTISVTFTPTATGKRVGTLTVTHSGSNSPSTASLAGTGVLQATLAPISAGFGSVTVGATSAAKTFTLTNNLSTILNNIAISRSGDFAISATTCSTSLAAKGKCTISITFKPTVKGTRTGTLTVSDSANNSPHTASLKGTGI